MKLAIRLIAIAGYCLCWNQISQADAEPANIALGKTVTLSTPATESYTIDKSPSVLTDGKYGGDDFDDVNRTSSLWVQKGALTWKITSDPVIVKIDLGKTMPISGVSYSTAAGVADVEFPSFVGILVSDDEKLWHYEGDLMRLSRKNGTPPDGYSKFRFVTRDLKTKGRYVALAIRQSLYTVTDEIEVYAGDDSWINLPTSGPTFSSLDGIVVNQTIQRRIAADIQTVRQALADSPLSPAAKTSFSNRLNQVAQDNEVFGAVDKNLKTVLPINNAHRTLMAIYGEMLEAEGVAPLTAWHQHRYAWLPFITKPSANDKREINITMLRNEYRSDALLLTNAGGKEKTVALRLNNPPTAAKEGWLKVDSVAWTDTYQGVPVADALLPATEENGAYLITIPAGFTQKVWLTVDASKVASGKYQSTILVEGQKIPFHLSVSKLAMKRPRMSLTMWDNADIKSLATGTSRGISLQNKAAALSLMKSHFVDSPWADRELLPWPQAEDFSDQNVLETALDFSDFDQWIAEWPQARTFFVFLHLTENDAFAGAQRGTKEFDARVGAYAKAFAQHMQKLKLRPDQVSFLIIDESRSELQDKVMVDWARAIRAGAPDISFVSDAIWERPDLLQNQESFSQMNTLMPNTQLYERSPKEVWDFYQQQKKDGRELWMYSCSGPVRLFNPQHYYRGQAWRVFSIGGKGMGFWSFNDIGGAPTAWNDYQIPISYSPAFLNKDTVENSIHWDSVREGVQDFEVLAMLQDAIKNTKDATLKSKAQAVLDEAVKAVKATETTDLWNKEENPELVDQQLQKVRAMLENLSA
jgi:hypothetical protein